MISGPDGLQASHMTFEKVGELETQRDLEDTGGHVVRGTKSQILKSCRCGLEYSQHLWWRSGCVE